MFHDTITTHPGGRAGPAGIRRMALAPDAISRCQRAFNPHRWQIITTGQADVGMLDVEYRTGEIYLSRIEIHPGHQGHGIGTRIISALVEEAQRTGQDLVLDVLTVNRRAQALYQRLGLMEVARHGDRDTKITMQSTRHRK